MRLVDYGGWYLTSLGRVDVCWVDGEPLAFRDDRLERSFIADGPRSLHITQMLQEFLGLGFNSARHLERRRFDETLLRATSLSATKRNKRRKRAPA